MAVMSPETLIQAVYIGGPTILLEIAGLRILTDPTFDPAGTKYTHLEKRTGPAIALDDIGNIDVILLSHDQHADNLDHMGRRLLGRAGCVLTTPSAAERLKGNAKGLLPWQTIEVPCPDGRTLSVTGAPARHGPPNCERVMGDVTGFVLSWSDRPRSAIYISGDTVWYEGVAEVAARFSIGIAILHLGDAHVAARGPDRLTMNAAEGILAAQALRPHTVIPVHYEGWAHFQEGKSQAQKIFLQTPMQSRVLWLDPAIRTVFRA